MGSLRDIRSRITAVQKTQKIVKAMKMVAAAKLARATSAINAARPYAEKLRDVLGSVASGLESDIHPMLMDREVRKLDLVLFTSDRGLCGAFNSNMIKRGQAVIDARAGEVDEISVIAIGRRGAEHYARHGNKPVRVWEDLPNATPSIAVEIASFLMERFAQEECDQTVLIYPEFVSALTQTPTEEILLPVRPPASESATAYEIEPSPEKLLGQLIPRAVEFNVFRALLETQAGEHGARMTSMDSATNNTEELTRTLTLDYNKARQAAITAELCEIVSGAEAL
ncbi:MAG: ATP synthase F1 subunit gamma [bacterium]|nr:ATP synthase F1 subunit gamma [bacterium]